MQSTINWNACEKLKWEIFHDAKLGGGGGGGGGVTW